MTVTIHRVKFNPMKKNISLSVLIVSLTFTTASMPTTVHAQSANRSNSKVKTSTSKNQTTSNVMSLEQYLNVVKKQNRLFNALDASVEASKAKMESGDIVLTPIFNAGYSIASDQTQPSMVADKRDVSMWSVGLSKKFVSGTSVKLTADTNENNYDGVKNPTVLSKFSAGSLGISLTQSLWKDFFGAATRVRHDREIAVNKVEVLQAEIQKKQFLIDAEAAFWNYLVAQEFRDLKKENFDRAKRIDQWTARRVSNGISDRSDLMNAKALSASNEVQLSSAESDLISQEILIRQNLNLNPSEPTPILQGDFKASRNLIEQLNKEKDVMRLDSQIQYLTAKSKELVAEEIRDQLRPDLTLTGSYNTSSYEQTYSEMMNNISRTDRPKTFVGLNFIYMFDTDAKTSQLTAAEKDALAAKYTAERALQQGRDGWTDLNNKYKLAQNNISLLEKLAQYQRERAKSEQDKLSKGRTTTFSVIQAETDAAEAEQNYLKAKSALRQLEASSQMFMPIQN